MKKRQKQGSLLQLVKELLPILMKEFKGYLILFILINLIVAVVMQCNVASLQCFLEAVTRWTQKKCELECVGKGLLIFAGVVIGTQLIQGGGEFIKDDLPQRMKAVFENRFCSRCAYLEPVDFEKTEFLDMLNKAEAGIDNSIIVLLTILIIGSLYIPYFILMTMYLYHLHPILAISIILVFIPSYLSQRFKKKYAVELEDNLARIRRNTDEYEKYMIDRQYFKETRSLGSFSYFLSRYKDKVNFMNSLIWDNEKKVQIKNGIANLFTLAGYAIVIGLLVYAFLHEQISIGAFAAVFSTINTIFSMMEELITVQMEQVVKNTYSSWLFADFISAPESYEQMQPSKEAPKIVFDGVSFQYPESESEALKELKFEVKPGETIAIVGRNGSGKSTLSKLILGLYRPTKGRVFIGGTCISNNNRKQNYEMSSALFQNFQRYKMTLDENVRISDIRVTEEKEREKKRNEASAKSALDWNSKSYPKGWETMLAKEYDGVDISGGQWQRIAMARALYRDSNLLVMDEPTSAIDPNEEARIYQTFHDVAKGKTAFIVTHRLGAVKLADRIIVMKDGRISQFGSHEELIKQNGEYRNLYRMQERWYREELCDT